MKINFNLSYLSIFTILSSTITISLLLKQIYSLKLQILTYENDIEKEKELRKIERKGRITTQKKKREDIQKEQNSNGYNFNPIGYIESPFPDRRGTPRQPNLVRAATGRIRFDKKRIQNEHFKELEEFSHIWIVWVFHENTNLDSTNIAAKIKPPRLHGSRVGCLSTRSPHRPNPIGLSVSEIVAVGPDYIDIISIDMIDGTPVLDIKPYIPYDIIPSNYNISMAPIDDNGEVIPLTSLRVPSWIYESDIPLREVNFTEQSLQALEELEISQQFKYCHNKQHAIQLIKQVLRQDIRSHHQGRSSTTTSLTDDNSHNNNNSSNSNRSVKDQDKSTILYECHLDSFTIQFYTYQDYILVENILISDSNNKK